jgi:hypothetical protein
VKNEIFSNDTKKGKENIFFKIQCVIRDGIKRELPVLYRFCSGREDLLVRSSCMGCRKYITISTPRITPVAIV